MAHSLLLGADNQNNMQYDFCWSCDTIGVGTDIM